MPREGGLVQELGHYLAELTPARTILWLYLLWWGFTVSRYFVPAPRLWLTSVGLSAIIGTGLYLSTVRGGKTITQLGGWQIARLYLMPFCVSSFAALIKDRGFFLVFHPTLRANLEAAGLCLAFFAITRLARPLFKGF
jgi:hypothetical protein